MWWEYLIIFGGLGLAVGYVLWTFLRSFRAKGNCCGTSCGCAPKDAQGQPGQRLRVTPLVELGSPDRSNEPDNAHRRRNEPQVP